MYWRKSPLNMLMHRKSETLKCWPDHFDCWLTSEHSKEAEHDRIEEAEAHGQGVLMDDGGHDEDREHGSCSEFPLGQLGGIRQRPGESLLQRSGLGWQQGPAIDTVHLKHSCESYCVTILSLLYIKYAPMDLSEQFSCVSTCVTANPQLPSYCNQQTFIKNNIWMKWLQQWCGWSWGEAGATCANGVVLPAGFIWPSRHRSAHPQKVSVSVVKQPVVNHHVPRAVIVGERCRVPPVLQKKVQIFHTALHYFMMFLLLRKRPISLKLRLRGSLTSLY